MTMDRTLKSRGGLAGTRSVLSRAERIARLVEEGKFDPEKNSPLGLSKTKVRHSRAGSKAKKTAEEVAAAAEGAAVEGAAAAAPATAGKAPAAGAKAPAGAKAAAGAKVPAAAPAKGAAAKGEAKKK